MEREYREALKLLQLNSGYSKSDLTKACKRLQIANHPDSIINNLNEDNYNLIVNEEIKQILKPFIGKKDIILLLSPEQQERIFELSNESSKKINTAHDLLTKYIGSNEFDNPGHSTKENTTSNKDDSSKGFNKENYEFYKHTNIDLEIEKYKKFIFKIFKEQLINYGFTKEDLELNKFLEKLIIKKIKTNKDEQYLINEVNKYLFMEYNRLKKTIDEIYDIINSFTSSKVIRNSLYLLIPEKNYILPQDYSTSKIKNYLKILEDNYLPRISKINTELKSLCLLKKEENLVDKIILNLYLRLYDENCLNTDLKYLESKLGKIDSNNYLNELHEIYLNLNNFGNFRTHLVSKIDYKILCRYVSSRKKVRNKLDENITYSEFLKLHKLRNSLNSQIEYYKYLGDRAKLIFRASKIKDNYEIYCRIYASKQFNQLDLFTILKLNQINFGEDLTNDNFILIDMYLKTLAKEDTKENTKKTEKKL